MAFKSLALFALVGVEAVLGGIYYEAPEGSRVPNKYIVTLKANITARAVKKKLMELTDKYGGNNEPVIELPIINGAEFTITEAEDVKDLLREDGVQAMEEVQMFTSTAAVPIDQNTPTSSWGVDRINTRNLAYDGMGLPASAKELTRGVDVYVVDTGIDVNHTQFEGRAVNFFTAYGSFMDRKGHGTHVAGIITSRDYGASFARVLNVRVLDDAGLGSTTSFLQGLAAISNSRDRNRPAIASLSLNGAYSQVVNDAVTRLYNDGVTVITAAGNSNVDACTSTPASARGTLVVGATQRDDNKAAYSNHGPCVGIFAPGHQISSTGLNQSIITMSGTSMATPLVSATAALYLGQRPLSTPSRVMQALMDNATPNVIGGLNNATANRMLYDVFSTALPVLEAPAPTTTTTTTPPPTTTTTTITTTTTTTTTTPPPTTTTKTTTPPPTTTTTTTTITLPPTTTTTTTTTTEPTTTTTTITTETTSSSTTPAQTITTTTQPEPTTTTTTTTTTSTTTTAPATTTTAAAAAATTTTTTGSDNIFVDFTIPAPAPAPTPTQAPTVTVQPKVCVCRSRMPQVVRHKWCALNRGCTLYPAYCGCFKKASGLKVITKVVPTHTVEVEEYGWNSAYVAKDRT